MIGYNSNFLLKMAKIGKYVIKTRLHYPVYFKPKYKNDNLGKIDLYTDQ